MNLPSLCKLPGRNKSTPFVFVAHHEFPLSCNIMNPYAGIQEKGSMIKEFLITDLVELAEFLRTLSELL